MLAKGDSQALTFNSLLALQTGNCSPSMSELYKTDISKSPERLLPLVQQQPESPWLRPLTPCRVMAELAYPKCSALPQYPEQIPPRTGLGMSRFLVPSEHCCSRDETEPCYCHCLSDYKVPLVERAQMQVNSCAEPAFPHKLHYK